MSVAALREVAVSTEIALLTASIGSGGATRTSTVEFGTIASKRSVIKRSERSDRISLRGADLHCAELSSALAVRLGSAGTSLS